MTKTSFTRTAAAIACTLVMSATCVLAAVAPAHIGTAPATASAARIIA